MILFRKLLNSNKLLLHNLGTTAYNVKVIVSNSNCPYENLAYEDHLYENVKLSDADKVLYIWRNKKAIVIGRHQNPWKEVNLDKMEGKGISLCRRMSGGGTVYHDLGNVNFTFFTSKKNYDRKSNLDFIINTLMKDFNIDLKRNEKDDIIFENQYKVSGTAAKLGLKNCYHHCTLLCNTDLGNLTGLLTNPFGANIKTNATESIKSKTKNLFDENNYDFWKIVDSFTHSFIESNSKGSPERYRKIDPSTIEEVISKKEILKSWKWTFEKSPKFSIDANFVFNDRKESVNVHLTINKGKIESFKTDSTFQPLLDILDRLDGCSLQNDKVLQVLDIMVSDNNNEYSEVASQMKKWFESINLIY